MKFLIFVAVLVAVYGQNAASPQACGVAKAGSGSIIGGDYIEPHSYPWIAAMTDSKGKYFCGGVVVSDRKVVTAAQCLQDKEQSNPRLLRDVKVLLGTHDLDEPFQVGQSVFNVEKIHIHDDWNPFSTSYDADIAVMVLDSKIIFDQFVQPICLIEDLTSPVFSIDTGIVVGYRKSEDESIKHENIPKVVSMPIFKNEVCFFNDYRVASLSSSRTFCGGFRNGTGVCKGDTGNGLILRHNDIFYLRGIVSVSLLTPDRSCGVSTYSVFTNIPDFHDWIDEISVEPFAK